MLHWLLAHSRDLNSHAEKNSERPKAKEKKDF
jgi:hypothetical protein